MYFFDKNKLLVGPLLNFLVVERENYINIVLAEISDSTCVTLLKVKTSKFHRCNYCKISQNYFVEITA